MKKFNLEIGKLGENMAGSYLLERGYEILEQNYRNKYAEIDIIAKRKDMVVFVEVKTRIGDQFGAPEDALNKNKIRRLARNANMYSARKGFNSYRVDAICIVLDERRQIQRINHYQSITS